MIAPKADLKYDRETIISRVRALRAKAGDAASSEAEVETAANIAAKLIARRELTEAELIDQPGAQAGMRAAEGMVLSRPLGADDDLQGGGAMRDAKMQPRPCLHVHGGAVSGHPGWICGQCWQIIPDRPRRYEMRPAPIDVATRGSAPLFRQEVTWQAEERRSAQGLTLGDFLIALAQRFAIRARIARDEAMEIALETMRSLRDMNTIGEFADPDSEWSRDAAKDIADEEMTYWDQEGGGSNG